jgi:predicted MPP superfamily phosphohydrolase
MSMTNTLFTWIHLSDIHVGHGDAKHAQDQKLVLNELKNDIRSAASRGVPAPDAIFVTGDLAFSGSVRSKTEYKRVGVWLTEIATSVSIPAEKIFVVPGNHDVQRNVEENDPNVAQMLKKLRSGKLKIDNILADKEKRALLAKRMHNYLKFAKQFAPANCLPEPRRADLFWSHRLKVSDELTFHLVGLNTALLAAKEEDKYGDFLRLQAGTGQIAHAFSSSSSDSQEELSIVLSHHPFNWLRDGDEVTAAVKKYAHIQLCGHVHNAESAQQRSGSGQELVTVIAGAVHEDASLVPTTYRHGYSFASVWVRDDGRLMLRIWPRLWSKNFEFRVDKDSIPATDGKGQTYCEDFVDHVLRLTTTIAPIVKNMAAVAFAVPTSATFNEVKCKALKDERDLLIAQYKEVSAAMLYALNPADRVVLRRQLDALEKRLAQVEAGIQKVCS